MPYRSVGFHSLSTDSEKKFAMETITRKEFLSLLGLSSAAVAVTYCFGGCQPPKSSVNGPPMNVDFTLDLTSPNYNALNSNGGYAYNDGVKIGRAHV